MQNPNDHVLEQVDAYLHDLLLPMDAKIVERHCERCPICQVALAEAQKRYEALRSLPPAAISERLLKSVERRVSLQRRRRFSGRRFALTGMAAAALLIGACHLYFLSLSASPYELRVLGQTELTPGSEASLRVLMLDHRTRRPLEGVPVSIELGGAGGAPRLTLASAVTDRSGSIAPRLRWPDWKDGQYELRITARPGWAAEQVTQNVKLRRTWRLMLSSDKPVYQPGQTIHLRSLALARSSSAPVAGREASFSISDPQGNTIFRQRQVTSRFGIAFTDCPLADEIATGAYEARCELDGVVSNLTLDVRKYVLPKFKLQVELDRPYYEPGQKLSGSLRADYFFGQPVADGQARIELRGQDEDGPPLAMTDVRTDAAGKAAFEFRLPQTLAGREEHQGDASLAIVANLTDTAGQRQSKTVSTLVTANPIRIEAIPEAGRLVFGLTNTIYLLTSYPDGRPAKTRIAVSGLDRELTTGELGVATMQVEPHAGTNQWVIRASDSAGLSGSREIGIATGQMGGDFLIRTDKAVYTGGETVELLALGPGEEPVFFDLLKDGQTLLTTSLEISGGRGRRQLDLPAELSGAVELCAYRFGEGGLPLRKTRALYVRPAHGVRIVTTQDRPEYRPGERAKLKFALTDEHGRPAPGALSLAAVDEAVFGVGQPLPGMRAMFSARENDLLKPVYKIYQWSPDFGSRGAGFVDAKQSLPEERARLEQALFAATAGAPGEDLPAELLPYLENSPAPFRVFDRPDWEDLVDSMQFSEQTKQSLRKLGHPYPLMADTFPAKQRAAESRRRVGLDAVKAAWMIFIALCVAPILVLLIFRITFVQALAVILMLGMLAALMLPAVQAAREAGRRSSAMNDLHQLGLALHSRHDSKVLAEVESAVADPDAQAPSPRLRQWFPETLLWRPELITDDRGEATLDIDLADSITTWRLSASAVTAAGNLGGAEHSIRVFQPFFVDLDLPVSLTRGDEVSMPAVVYNYLDRPQTVALSMTPPPGIELLDEAERQVELAPGEVRSVSYRLRATGVGRQSIEVRASGAGIADAVKREIEVVPDGRLVEQAFSGALDAPAEIALTVPETAIPGSAATWLKLYPSNFSQLVEGLDAIFERPYGCFEQASSTTYPNVLALDYLRRTKQSVPAVEAKARQYIHLGYQRLLSFEIPGGGFDWFGNPPANRTLTAYGLREFVDMAKVHDVDPELIARTRRWLLDQQQADGSWAPESHRLHDDPTRSRGDLARLSATAFVAGAVFAESAASDDPSAASRAALDYLLAHPTDSIDDPYVLALMAQTIRAIAPRENAARSCLDRLDSLKQISPDGKRVWWNLPPDGATTFYGGGETGAIEATALAAEAMIEAKRHPNTASRALAWLVEQKDARGTWHSTQATVLALKALLAGAGKGPLAGAGKTPDGESARQVEVAVDGRMVERIAIPAEEFDVVRQIDLTSQVGTGSRRLTLTGRDGAAVGYELLARHYAPRAESTPAADSKDAAPQSPASQSSGPLSIRLAYDRSALTVGDAAMVTATVVNNRGRAAPMVVLDLPIPPGFSADVEDFDRLLTRRAIAKYQVTARGAIVYLRELPPAKPLSLGYHLRSIMPVSVTARGAVSYEYYNPAVRAVDAPTALTVEPR